MNIWNILHDGEITAIEWLSKEEINLFISIPYLRRRVKPIGDSFILHLSGVKQIIHIDYSGNKESLEVLLDGCSPQILGLKDDLEEFPLSIETTNGNLIIDYESIEYELDRGGKVDIDVIEKICIEYWNDWKIKHNI